MCINKRKVVKTTIFLKQKCKRLHRMEKIMSRLKIATPNKAQLTVERLYKDLERRIIASPPGLCPVDL